MEILNSFTILENLNWKGTFKEGQFFIRCFLGDLKGYKVSGLTTDRKTRLQTLFLLKEDIDKCKVINESNLLQPYIEKLKCVE